MSYDSSADALDRDLVFTFFWQFSVFECALKRGGFLKAGRYGEAQPDWSAFALSIRGRFGDLDDPDLRQALEFLATCPPKRQVVLKGRLGWEDIDRKPGTSDESYSLRLVGSIRNNLFHGGKYPDGPIEQVERDQALLESALKVLDACYALHRGIASWRMAA